MLLRAILWGWVERSDRVRLVKVGPLLIPNADIHRNVCGPQNAFVSVRPRGDGHRRHQNCQEAAIRLGERFNCRAGLSPSPGGGDSVASLSNYTTPDSPGSPLWVSLPGI